jgi:chromate transport protein ChrA
LVRAAERVDADLRSCAEQPPVLTVLRLPARGWLLFHLKLGLFGFGHGAVMPMYERALVRDSTTLSEAQFHEALTASLVLPGPSLITLSMYLGTQLYGSAIGLLGVLCMCVPGALWALLIVYAIPIEHPAVQALFHGFTVGALVLLTDMVWRMQRALRADAPASPPVLHHKYLARLAISALVAGSLLAQLPIVTVAGLGVLGCLAVEFCA